VKKQLAIVFAATLVAVAAIAEPGGATPSVQLIPTGKAVWPDRGYVVSLS